MNSCHAQLTTTNLTVREGSLASRIDDAKVIKVEVSGNSCKRYTFLYVSILTETLINYEILISDR